MPDIHKPRSGTLQFWPRKRAARIFPRISRYPKVNEAKPLLFAAYKAGMTRTIVVDTIKGSPSLNQPVARAVSVLDAAPMFVLGVRAYGAATPRASSFDVFSDNIPKELRTKYKSKHKLEDLSKAEDLRLIVATQPTKSGLGKKTPEVFEVGLGGTKEAKIAYAKEKLGKEIHFKDVFNEGEFVDVSAVTKGKGFQGVVKRFGIRVRSRKDEKHRRQIGVHGPEGLGRILFSIPMHGQMGFHTRTEFNKQIFKIGTEGFTPKGGFVKYGSAPSTYVLLSGTVPGPKKRLVFIRAPMRAHRKGFPVTIQYVDTTSQQGKGAR